MDVEITKPGRNWKESVASIITMGQFLSRMRGHMDRHSLAKMARIDYNIDDSTIDKITKISQHPVLSNPAYAAKLPPQWGTLYELKFIPDDFLVEKINAGETQYVTKYTVWEWRGAKRRDDRSGLRPARVRAADGTSLIEYVRGGMALEDDSHGSVEKVAKGLGLSADSYRKIRMLILLSDRPELNDTDKEFVAGILAKIEKTRNVRSPYEEAKPLLERVWGSSRNKFASGKGSHQRVDKFRNAIVILSDTCERVLEMEQPYMSAEDIDKSINELTKASKTIRRIAENLRRAKDV